MSPGYLGKFLRSQCKIQLSRDSLGEWKVLKRVVFGLSENLQSKISIPVATMVALPCYTGFITNLPFGATRRLERMVFYRIAALKSFIKYIGKYLWYGSFFSKDLQLFLKKASFITNFSNCLIWFLSLVIFQTKKPEGLWK